MNDASYAAEAEKIRAFVLENGVVDGAVIKFLGTTWVDASLIHVSTPYRLLAPNDPIMRATIARLETELLVPGGGIHRYVADNYYGGGEWILLPPISVCTMSNAAMADRARALRPGSKAKPIATSICPNRLKTTC